MQDAAGGAWAMSVNVSIWNVPSSTQNLPMKASLRQELARLIRPDAIVREPLPGAARCQINAFTCCHALNKDSTWRKV